MELGHQSGFTLVEIVFPDLCVANHLHLANLVMKILMVAETASQVLVVREDVLLIVLGEM
jgi:hypothetical protein